ncbi:hypothetical protein ACF1AB_35405 [Streptomyces sp. NPDC014846]|uniref:tetratricopeptide repeat protein n=1 Tax=Streptomyces sp. NPDC014846 TaxID=3364922 RepID=UPI0036FD15A7
MAEMTVWDEARRQFAYNLAEVHRAANSPSLATLAKASKKQSTRKRDLHPSAVSLLLRAEFTEPPDWDLVGLFVMTCRAIAATQPPPRIPQLFNLRLWKSRLNALEQVWQLVREAETRAPSDLRPFPPKEAQPLAADLRGQPSQLLLARHEVVPFTGRADDLAALAGWRDGTAQDGQPIAASVALLHGFGGQGKTRLATELARQTAKLGWKVWQAVRADQAAADTGRGRRSALARRALVVVDYAERWPARELELLLERLADQRGDTLRVLLIARSTSWWSYLLDDLRKWGFAHTEYPLRPLPDGDVDARLQTFTAARERFAEALGLPAEDAESLAVPGDLSHAAYGLTLTVHMAALVAVDARIRGDEPPQDPGALSAYLLERERGHWSKLEQRKPACAAPAEVMAQAVYTATLTGPRDYRAAITALKSAEVENAALHPQVLREHAACYPADDPRTYLEPLCPDRLGEDFVALSTPGPAGSHLATAWAEQAAARLLGVATHAPSGSPAPEWSRHVLTQLINAAARWPHLAAGELAPLATEHPGLMLRAGNAALATLARIKQLPIEALQAIEEAAPLRDPDLDVGIADITERYCNERIEATSDPAVKAALYAKKAGRLSHSGRHEEALKATDEAVQLHRDLAGSGDVEAVADLAWALNGQSNELQSTGRHPAALESAEAAVALFTKVVAQGHPEKIANLAVAFTTLSLCLDQQGRTAEGLELLQSAVRITRYTAEVNPADFRPDLAAMLHNLGSQLSRVDRYREALAAESEAVSLYEKLVEQAPEAHLDNLANALDGLATALRGEGRYQEALQAGEKAVGYLRAGAENNPGSWNPPLANALLHLGDGFGESGHLREAVRHCGESVDMSRELAATRRGAHLPLLARSVMHLGIWLSRSGSTHKAVPHSEEAVGLFRELIEQGRENHLPDLADSLLNLSLSLSETSRTEECVAAAQEAVGLYRRLGPATSVVYRRKLAIALVNLGNGHAHRDDPVTSVECLQEAVELAREVAKDDPVAGRPILADALTNLGREFGRAGLRAPSLSATREAVTIRQALAKTDPAVHEPNLAAALVILCDALSRVGHYEEAIEQGTQAVAILQRLSQAAPAAHQLRLALSLRSLGLALAALNRLDRAVEAGEQEVHAWRCLAQADKGCEFDLTVALETLGRLQTVTGQYKATVRTYEEIVALRRRLSHPKADQLLALSLINLTLPLAELNRHEDILARGEEAVAILRRLAEEDPAAHQPTLVMGLVQGLGLPLARSDQWQLAEGHLREAVALQRRLAQEDPAAQRPALANLLVVTVRARISRRHALQDALAAAEEAVEIYGALAARSPAAFRAPLHESLQLRDHLRATVPFNDERPEQGGH